MEEGRVESKEPDRKGDGTYVTVEVTGRKKGV